MRPAPHWLTAIFAIALLGTAQAQGEREQLSQPLPGLSADQMSQFLRGRSLFRQSWVIAPSRDSEVDGLGPLYNRLACISCHAKNGRGGAPATPDERMQSMLVRLSVPGRSADGAPKPHPVYGDQLNEEGIPGVHGEGRVQIAWQPVPTQLADGTRLELRKPKIRFVELAYGDLGRVLTSLRVSPHVAGLGLLDAVPAATLEAMTKEKYPDGISAAVNRVKDAKTGQLVVGRFGLKANAPNLRQQIAGAFVGDMSITSELFPHENCTPAQTACRKAPHGGQPELSHEQLDDIEFYVAHLAPPPRRNVDAPQVRQGEMAFTAFGCAACHRPTLTSGEHPRYPLLSNRSFAPYTDLLLHDMGQALADGRPDFQANGRQWRTPPLWGLGLLQAINENVGFLHDGRARTAEEAILWHGGEAGTARHRYAAADSAQRSALLAFLESL